MKLVFEKLKSLNKRLIEFENGIIKERKDTAAKGNREIASSGFEGEGKGTDKLEMCEVQNPSP